MYVGRTFDPAQPAETDFFGFDFVKDLEEGELILSATFALAVVSGTDNAVADRMVGDAKILDTKCSQKISGLVAGVNYRIEATVTTNEERVLKLWSHIECRAPA